MSEQESCGGPIERCLRNVGGSSGLLSAEKTLAALRARRESAAVIAAVEHGKFLQHLSRSGATKAQEPAPLREANKILREIDVQITDAKRDLDRARTEFQPSFAKAVDAACGPYRDEIRRMLARLDEIRLDVDTARNLAVFRNVDAPAFVQRAGALGYVLVELTRMSQ